MTQRTSEKISELPETASLSAGAFVAVVDGGVTKRVLATNLPGGGGGGTGDVVGPASAVNQRIVTFNGTTGKLVADGGSTIAEVLSSADSAAAARDVTVLATALAAVPAAGGAPANVTAAAASAGAAATWSRSDHKHDISTAAPGAVNVSGVAASAGSASSLARSDHTHSLTGSLPWTNIAAAPAKGQSPIYGGSSWGFGGVATKAADLTDASVTVTVADGNRFVLPGGTLSASRNLTLGITGSPTDKEVISVERYDVTANTYLVKDSVGTTIYTFPASTRRRAVFQYAGEWTLIGHEAITGNL